MQEGSPRIDQIHVAGDRLDDDGSQLVGVFLNRFIEGSDVVIRQYQGMRRYIGRYTPRRGVAKSQQAGTGFDQETVGVAVITALELDDQVASSEASGQSNSTHGGLSP